MNTTPLLYNKMKNPIMQLALLTWLAHILLTPTLARNRTISSYRQSNENAEEEFLPDRKHPYHQNIVKKRSYGIISVNKDQEKQSQDCKQQLTDKNQEVVKLNAQLKKMIQTCPSSSVAQSSGGSDLIEPGGIQKVFTNNIKGTPYTRTVVCFMVQRSPPFNKDRSVIMFEEEVINLGNTFNLEESIFVAPKTGIYEFAFSGHKTGKQESLNVSLRINGKDAVNAWSHFMMGIHRPWSNFTYLVDNVHRFRNMISMHSMLKLNKGDRIDLYNKQGSLHDSNTHHTHFTGKLLFEDASVTIEGSSEVEPIKPVYFVAQKNTGFSVSRSVIPFEIESLNVGGSFDLKKSVFTAPIPGIYEFTVKGHKIGENDHMSIYLRLNGKPVANAWVEWTRFHDIHTSFSIHSILKLEEKDRVDLYLSYGHLYDNNNRYTTFTGKLLKKTNNQQDQGVYFNVQKNASFTKMDATIPFEIEVLNVGKAFNLKQGYFTAPRGGIYEFIFNGIKTGSIQEFCVALRLNGKPVGYAWADYVLSHNFNTPFSIHSILKAKKGDRVDLFNRGDGDLLDGIGNLTTHFTGKLLFGDSDLIVLG